MKSILLMLVFYFCCLSGEKDRPIQNENSYFPLQIGNTWKYEIDKYSLSIFVKDIIEIKGSQYASVQEESSSREGNPVVRRKLLRCNEKKNIELMVFDFESIRSNVGSTKEVPNSGISIWYKFDAKVNDSWQAFGNALFDRKEIHKFTIKLLSKTDTVTAKDTTYTACYKFHIDDLTESDSEYFEWFAKDVGLVKRVFQNESEKGFVLTTFKKTK